MYFDANKANHTGDNVVCRRNGDFQSRFIYCRFEDAAGGNLVLDGQFYDDFVSCRFRRAGSYGVRMLDTSGAENSSMALRGGTDIRSNASGGVMIEGSNITHGIRFDTDSVIEENGGPATHITGDTRDLQCSANILLNDGPALYANTGGLSWSWNFEGAIKNNNQNVTITSATDVGEFHFEGSGTKLGSLNLFGTTHQGTGAGRNSVIAANGADRVRVMLLPPRWVEGNFTHLVSGGGAAELSGLGNNVRPEGNITGLNFGVVLTDNGKKI